MILQLIYLFGEILFVFLALFFLGGCLEVQHLKLTQVKLFCFLKRLLDLLGDYECKFSFHSKMGLDLLYTFYVYKRGEIDESFWKDWNGYFVSFQNMF